MTRKVYKSAMGKDIDIGALMLQNENVRAVGNMSVNARGDLLDSNNNVIETANQRLNKQYSRQVAKPTAKVDTHVPKNNKQKDLEKENDDFQEARTPAKGGVASAIAKAQSAKSKQDKK